MKWIKMDNNTMAAVADTTYTNLLRDVAEERCATLGDAVMGRVKDNDPSVKLHDGMVAVDPWKMGAKKAHEALAEATRYAEAKKAEREKTLAQKRIEKLQAKLDALNAAANG